jgi:hypothetical protein
MSDSRMKIHPLPVVVAILFFAGAILLTFDSLEWIGIALLVVGFLIALAVASGLSTRVRNLWRAIIHGYP